MALRTLRGAWVEKSSSCSRWFMPPSRRSPRIHPRNIDLLAVLKSPVPRGPRVPRHPPLHRQTSSGCVANRSLSTRINRTQTGRGRPRPPEKRGNIEVAVSAVIWVHCVRFHCRPPQSGGQYTPGQRLFWVTSAISGRADHPLNQQVAETCVMRSCCARALRRQRDAAAKPSPHPSCAFSVRSPG
jgi:hypothetical protein